MLSFLSRCGLVIEHKHLFALLVYIWAYGPPHFLMKRRRRRPLVRNAGVTFDDPLMELQQHVPGATAAECRRFLKARGGNVSSAALMLQRFLDWHFQHAALPSSSFRNKLDDPWEVAVSKALSLCNEKINSTATDTNLPQVATMLNAVDVDGRRILHITPGKIDERLASLQAYSLAIALYIDQQLDRDSLEKVTVTIDVRGGTGWRSLHATQLVPFIQHTSTLLLAQFPERLARSVVYPIPSTFTWIWRLVRRCIDPLTRDKICLLTGPATIASPPPRQAMEAYLGKGVVETLERDRLASFVYNEEDQTKP